MNISIINGGYVKNGLYSGDIDFDSHTFKSFLVRSGFNFAALRYGYKINFKASSGSITAPYLVIDASAKTFTRSDGGSFITNGFVSGNQITCSGSGDHATGVYRVTSVTATVLRTVLVSGNALTDYNPTTHDDPDHDITITANDELPDGTDGYLDTNNGGRPGGVTVTFTVNGDELTLDPFNLSTFGPDPLLDYSPGMIIYDDTHANDIVICYAIFDPWSLQF